MKRPMFVVSVFILLDTLLSLSFVKLNLEILLFIKFIFYFSIFLILIIALGVKYNKILKYKNNVINILIITGFLTLFSFMFLIKFNLYVKPQYNVNNKEIDIIGTVIDKNNNDYFVKVNDSCDMNLENKTVLITSYKSYINVGDVIEFKSVFKKIVNNNDFNAVDYYSSKNVFITANIDNFNTIGVKKDFNYYLIKLRKYLENSIYKVLSKNEGDIVNSLILGTDNVVDDTYLEKVRSLGLSHIFSISGLHISIIAMFLIYILTLLKCNKLKYIVAIILVFLYMILIGYSPSISRAVIMFIVTLVGLLINRYSDMLSNVSLAFLFSLIINPYIIYSISFMLTFMAVFSICVTNKPIDNMLSKFIKNKFIKNLSSVFFMSLFITLFTLPIVVKYFKSVNLLSPIINVIVVPLVTPIIILGIITIILSSLGLTILSKCTGLILGLLVKFLMFLTNTLNETMLITINFNSGDIFIFILTLFVIITSFMLLYKKKKLIIVVLLLIIMAETFYILSYFKPNITIINSNNKNHTVLYIDNFYTNVFVFNKITNSNYSKIKSFINDKGINNVDTMVFLDENIDSKYINDLCSYTDVNNILSHKYDNGYNTHKLRNIDYTTVNINMTFNGNYDDFILSININNKTNIIYKNGLIKNEFLTNADVLLSEKDIYYNNNDIKVNVR